MTDNIDTLCRVIADHMPSSYALDIAYRADGEFDLNAADPKSAEEWREMARAVVAAIRKGE